MIVGVERGRVTVSMVSVSVERSIARMVSVTVEKVRDIANVEKEKVTARKVNVDVKEKDIADAERVKVTVDAEKEKAIVKKVNVDVEKEKVIVGVEKKRDIARNRINQMNV